MDGFASEASHHERASQLQDEAFQILQTSTSIQDILLVCSYLPFQDSDIPLSILSSRTDIDELELQKVRDNLKRIAAECNSCSWDWEWSPPLLSSTMENARVAYETDKNLLTFASNVTFNAVVRYAFGLQSKAVENIFDGIDHVRQILHRQFNELRVPKKRYEAVKKELKSPLAYWAFSESLQSGDYSPVPSDAMASVLHPTKQLLENPNLSLMSVLQRLKVLEVLYQDIMDGKDPKWEGLCEEGFSLLEDLNKHTPQRLAELLTEKNISGSQKLCSSDFARPAELRNKYPVWSRLVYDVSVCAKAHPKFVRHLDATARILLRYGNLFSGMALIYGLSEAQYPPEEAWWNLFPVTVICMAYELHRTVLGVPQSLGDNNETKNGRSCVGALQNIALTRIMNLLGMPQNMTNNPHASGRPLEYNREPEHLNGVGPWRFTTAVSEVGPGETDRRRIGNASTAASNPLCAGSGNLSQNVNNTSQADAEAGGSPETHNDSDTDSAIELARTDSTTTLSLEVLNPVEKHGREYHGYHKGKYLLPSDEQEQERLDFQHKLFLLTLGGKLHLAPLPTMHRALDVGTGTGIWAIAFADEHPETEVLGVDFSPIQPNWVPSNCEFQIDDISLSWNFNSKFEFIHCRMSFYSFSEPIHIFNEAFKALAAGGILEMQDVIFDFRSHDDSLKGSALEDWAKRLKDAFGSEGIDLTCASRYRNFLEIAGFEDIQQREFCWPVGTWPEEQNLKILGESCLANILGMLFAISIVALTEHGQHRMSVEEVELLLMRVRKDLRDPGIHAFLEVLVIHGRKPKSATFQI